MADFLLHLLRGGSWLTHPRNCRLACRLLIRPDVALNYVGFRVVCLHQTGHAIRLEEQADG